MVNDEEKIRKQMDIEKKRAEVRARMVEASKAKKAKKGFMTPERKKNLRLLLRKKALEELKKEQELKIAERGRIIEEKCRALKLEGDSEDELKRTVKAYHQIIVQLEEAKFDLEYVVKKKEYEVTEVNIQLNTIRGKFVKPPLNKVGKYGNKFAKLQKKAAEFNFRNQLKAVKKKEFTLDEEDKEKKPDWSKKAEKVQDTEA